MKRNDELFIYTTLLHYNHNISTNDSYEMCNSISVNVKLPVWNTCTFSIYLCLAYPGFKQTQVSMQRWQSILESFSKQHDWNVIIHHHKYGIGVFVWYKTPWLATSDFIISYRIHNVVRMIKKHNSRKHGTENIKNSSSQVTPVFHSAQVHAKSLTSSTHVPPLAHGLFSQSLISINLMHRVDQADVNGDT